MSDRRSLELFARLTEFDRLSADLLAHLDDYGRYSEARKRLVDASATAAGGGDVVADFERFRSSASRHESLTRILGALGGGAGAEDASGGADASMGGA